MVHYSEQIEYLKELSEIIQSRVENQLVQQLFEVPDEYKDLVLEQIILFYEKVEASRYLFRGTYRKEVENVFSEWLLDSKKHNDSEFLNQFCISRGAFSKLTELIENDKIFKNHIGKIKKAPPVHHLLIFLFMIGLKENGASPMKIAKFFRIGFGSVFNFL